MQAETRWTFEEWLLLVHDAASVKGIQRFVPMVSQSYLCGLFRKDYSPVEAVDWYLAVEEKGLTAEQVQEYRHAQLELADMDCQADRQPRDETRQRKRSKKENSSAEPEEEEFRRVSLVETFNDASFFYPLLNPPIEKKRKK